MNKSPGESFVSNIEEKKKGVNRVNSVFLCYGLCRWLLGENPVM